MKSFFRGHVNGRVQPIACAGNDGDDIFCVGMQAPTSVMLTSVKVT